MRRLTSAVTIVAAFAALAAVLLAGFAPAARADGDPGSDVLVYQDLFAPTDAGLSVPQQAQLGSLLAAANRDGVPIRVAIIARQDDLGAVTALWRQPAAYARFLGIELSLAYKQRLLVVMPNGFGFYWTGHSAVDSQKALAKVPLGPGSDGGLGTSAQAAVRALAAASGVRLPATGVGNGADAAAPAPAGGGFHWPLAAGVSLAVVLAAAITVGLLLRRRGYRLPVRPLPRLQLAGRLPLDVRPRLPAWPRRISITVAMPVFLVVLLAVAVTVTMTHAGGNDSIAQAAVPASNQNLDPGTTLSGSAPGFTLTDQFGQPVSLSSFRGNVTILSFDDSECTTLCPLTTVAMLDAKAMLGSAGAHVQLLGVDSNPRATSLEDVESYSQLHGMLHRWHFLTGSLPQLRRVWKDYSVGVQINQDVIDHTPAVFIIGPDGKLAKLYLVQQSYSVLGQLGQLLAQAASALLPGHPPVRSHLSYDAISGITPGTPSRLPRSGGGTVTLGPGRPRLYLFFATWDRGVTGLAGQLDALNRYSGPGLPPLTAVDEGSVEPSSTALRDFLATLPRPLSYPVAVDTSGRIADGYQVQGQPWFVLTSSSGRILWSDEISTSGWPTPAALTRKVRTALARTGSGH